MTFFETYQTLTNSITNLSLSELNKNVLMAMNTYETEFSKTEPIKKEDLYSYSGACY